MTEGAYIWSTEEDAGIAKIVACVTDFVMTEGAMMIYRDEGVVKVITIKYGGHRYYVQEMPGYNGMGRRYAVMCDRRRLCDKTYNNSRQAVEWLLAYMCRLLDQFELHI